MGEIRKDNLHESLIEELNDLANIDLSGKQDKTDESLLTESKDVIGAINELFQSGTNVKQELVDALVSKGIDCSTSDSFGDLISKINVLTADCTNITLDKSSLAFSVAGETQTLMATVTPSDFPKDIIWDSTNDNVAIVSNGQVTAVDTGECIVSALAGTKLALCNIEVSLSEGYLVKDGKLINSGKFGNYVTDDTIVIYNESNKRLEISAMNRTIMFSFDKFNETDTFANGGVIEITAYRQQLYGAVPYIFVALVDEPLCIGDNGFLDNCSVSQYVNARVYTTMSGGTTVTKYNFSLSGLQNYEGYLAIIISANDANTGYVYINDIKYTLN